MLHISLHVVSAIRCCPYPNMCVCMYACVYECVRATLAFVAFPTLLWTSLAGCRDGCHDYHIHISLSHQ